MAKFNFDAPTDRKGSYSYKWDNYESALPMWVADMDFETAPVIKEAIIKRAEHGIFGYSYTPDEYFNAISNYFERRHSYRFSPQDMVYSTGIVASVSSLVRKLSTPAENVLIQAPVYNIFYNCILNNGRNVLSSDLVYDGEKYEIDFTDLEAKLALPQTTLFIVCNPHNPVGKIFTKSELAKIGELCKKHGVTVISDEIHCEFTNPKCAYTPFASASEICRDISVTLVSNSKTFNLAGLASACAIAHSTPLRNKVYRALNTDEIGEPNAFAIPANIAAYNYGDEWLDELVDYINANKAYASEFITKELPMLKAPNSSATYLLWVDISALGIDSVSFCKRLREEGGLYLNDGEEYGECGKYFVRINLATQRYRVVEGMKKLKAFIDSNF